MSRIPSADQHLIDRLILNDTAAFEELYRHYWFGLYMYCLKKLQSPEDARIIVRTLFVAIWEQRHSLPESFSISTYLYKEVRKSVVKCLSEKLTNTSDSPAYDKRFSKEFSIEALQEARKPARREFAFINKPSELLRQQTGQIGTANFHAAATFKWMLHSLTNKFSLNNLL
ncbi:RNA polymerase sigma factor [Terrimonas alba]|uniref:RNA polymerase sigma factor n=1 Tax=Terrimonas alba TaxID=3349636 RepID=UPI0035F31387